MTRSSGAAGNPHQAEQWYKALARRKAKQRAGIEGFRFRDVRYTWASWHAQSAASLRELMELGGWRSYETVLR